VWNCGAIHLCRQLGTCFSISLLLGSEKASRIGLSHGLPPLTMSGFWHLSPVQVTNPPIDPLREGLVMSLEMRLGGRGNLLQPGANTYRQVRSNSSSCWC
jgi:hypothetical protein